MSYYYCTCLDNPSESRKRAVVNGRTPFREIPASNEGVCLNCGFYAVAYFKKVNPNRVKLYDKLFECGIAWKAERVEGGLSIKRAKEIEKRKRLDDERKDTNGNLDNESLNR